MITMKRSLIVTSDGSHSISVPELNVTYHSIHGAIQESMHVFINAGLNFLRNEVIQIFEVGFGTGLNALLTIIESEKSGQIIYYETIEPFPISADELHQLNYCDVLNRKDLQPIFEKLHNCEWEIEISITKNFISNI